MFRKQYRLRFGKRSYLRAFFFLASGRSSRAAAIFFFALFSLVSISGCGNRDTEHVQPATPVIRRNTASGPIFSRSFITMGRVEAKIQVCFDPPENDAAARKALDAAEDAVVRVNSLMSNYIPDSEISRLTRATREHPIRLSRETLSVLNTAKILYQISDGAFDPTIGPVVRLYKPEQPGQPGRWPDDETLASAMRKTGFQHVFWNEKGEAWTDISGMEIDLGAIAKGFAVDVAADALKKNGASGGLVDIGGEIRVFGAKPGGKAWVGGLQHPRKLVPGTDQTMAVFDFHGDEALATSGDYRQGERGPDGKWYSHILDARTGRPLQGGAVSVSVFAKKCVVADGLATLVSILGFEKGSAAARRFPGVEILVIEEASESGNASPRLIPKMTNGLRERIHLNLE